MTEPSDPPPDSRDAAEPVPAPPKPSRPASRRRPARRGRYADDELEAQRDAVVASASHVFLEHGVGGTSFQAIAREAHVSPKTIYAWFGGKPGLFAAVLERTIGDMSRGLAETLDPELPLQRTLEDFGGRWLDLVLSPRSLQLYRIVTAEASRLPGIAEAFERAGPRHVLELLIAHLESRELPDAALAAEAFIGAAQGRALRRAMLGVGTSPTPAERRLRVAYAARLVVGTAAGAVGDAGPSPRADRPRR